MADDIHLVVATPCFGGQVSSLYLAAMLKLQGALRGYSNIRMTLELDEGDALITRSRANLVARFLDNPAATHLLFIDADIGFEAEQVLRLLVHGADMSAASYPIKRIDWEQSAAHHRRARRPDPRSAALHYRPRSGGSRPYRPGGRVCEGPLCRDRIPDDPAARARGDVQALCRAELPQRPLLCRSAGREPEPLRPLRLPDRRADQALISARISASANVGPTWAARSGSICKAASTLSGPPHITATLRPSSPKQRRK